MVDQIPEDEKYHIVHHLKQKPLRVLSLDLCKLYEQLPSSKPTSFLVFYFKKYVLKWTTLETGVNEQNVLIIQTCS